MGNWKDAVGVLPTAMSTRWHHVRCGDIRYGLRIDLRSTNRGRDARVLLDTPAERPVPELQRCNPSHAAPRARPLDAVVEVELVHRLWLERDAPARPSVRGTGHFRQDTDAPTLSV